MSYIRKQLTPEAAARLDALTPQALFDNAAHGIRIQGYAAALRNGACVVMSASGQARCALAWSVQDAEPGQASSPEWDYLAIKGAGFPHHMLAKALQKAHDNDLARYGKIAWLERLLKIAQRWNLDPTEAY